MKTKIFMILTILFVILFSTTLVKADLVFDSGYNIFDDNDPYYNEVWVINDAVLDVLGGAMWKLELTDYAMANVYSGNIDLLVAYHNTVVNIHGGTLDSLISGHNNLVYLYAYDVIYHPTGGLQDGWIEGRYYSNNELFSFSFGNSTTYAHLNIVPESTSILLLGIGGMLLRKKSNRIIKNYKKGR